MIERMKRLFKDEEGATLVEYALMVALIAVVCILVITQLGRKAGQTFDNTQKNLAPANQVQPS